jgi:predicted Zn finger-like uncharacterized protein
MSILTQTHQILMVTCPECNADFAVAHHKVEDAGKQWSDSEIVCSNETCNRRGFASSSESMLDAMRRAMTKYQGG